MADKESKRPLDNEQMEKVSGGIINLTNDFVNHSNGVNNLDHIPDYYPEETGIINHSHADSMAIINGTNVSR